MKYSLNITWNILPINATAEVYGILENGEEDYVLSSTSNSCLITNLENEKLYKYRVSLSYIVAGKKQETKGVIVSGMPTCPPSPIDTLRIKPLQKGWFEAVWRKTNAGEVCLYGSTNKPAYYVGEVVALSELERKMTQLQQKNLSTQMLSHIKTDETSTSFEYSENETMYVVAVVVKAGTAVLGNIVRVGIGETVTIKSIRPVNGKINIYIEPPKNATGFVVLYRFDQFPTDIGDVKTVRKYVPFKQYQLNSAILLDTLEERKYYFTVYAEFKQDEEKDYSSGTDYMFDNSAKLNIIYSINVNKKMFGERSLTLGFEADCQQFILPDIDIMSAIGNAPMFKSSAKLFYTISSQMVNGSIKVKIPLPKTMSKDTYIKAFFKDESMQNGNQLLIKDKSKNKIS